MKIHLVTKFVGLAMLTELVKVMQKQNVKIKDFKGLQKPELKMIGDS